MDLPFLHMPYNATFRLPSTLGSHMQGCPRRWDKEGAEDLTDLVKGLSPTGSIKG